MKCEIRYWRDDQVKSQLTTEADSLEQALRRHLSEPGWIDARGWPIERGAAGELFAANPDDPSCMIEAVGAAFADTPSGLRDASDQAHQLYCEVCELGRKLDPLSEEIKAAVDAATALFNLREALAQAAHRMERMERAAADSGDNPLDELWGDMWSAGCD